MKVSRSAVFVLVVLMLLLMCNGCSKQDDFKQDNYNDVEILSTKKVVDLLKENGVVLTKTYNFPINLSLCKVHDKKPKPYFNRQTGVYYMFYEYDGYSETSDLIKNHSFYESCDNNKKFSDFIIPCTESIGKNLYICLWYSEFVSWPGDMSKKEKEDYDCIIKENLKLKNILKEKCFDKKVMTLTGQGDSWKVKMPISYVYNQRVNEKGIIETVSYSKCETLIKYLNSEKELPDVSLISWSIDTHNVSSTTEIPINKLEEETEYEDGYYSVSFYRRDSLFNPEFESNVIVNITCSNGETEEITCEIENKHE